MPDIVPRRNQLKRHLALGVGSLLLLLLVLGWHTRDRLQEASRSLESIYQDRIVCLEQLRLIGEAYTTRIPATVALTRDGAIDPAEAVRRIDEARRDADLQWANYKNTYLTPPESRLIAETEPDLQLARAGVDEIKHLLARPDTRHLDRATAARMVRTFAPLAGRIEALIRLQLTTSKLEVEHGSALFTQTVWVTSTLGTLITAGACLFAWSLWRRHTDEERAHARRLTRLNSYYLALSQTSQLIVREPDPAVLLGAICRICVEQGRSKVACVFLMDGGTASRSAIAGADDELSAVIPTTLDLSQPRGRKSMLVQALLSGKHAISQDYERDAPSAHWRARAAAMGVRSAAAFPLLRRGEIVGALVLYAAEVGFFQEPLVRLLDEMAEDVSFALENIERANERRREQRLVAESLANFRAVFQASPISGVIAELDTGVVLEANDTFCERYGVARGDVVGHSLYELGIGMIREDAERYHAITLREGRVRNMEARARLRDGTTAIVLANTETIQYMGRACLLSMTMDVTELRRAAAAREAQIEAEAANRAKNEFLSRMSHELRTPLNAMLGFTQLMRRDARERMTPQDLRQLDHIHRAGWHLMSLVNDVLDVSRIEAGIFNVRSQALALAPVLDEAMQLSRDLATQSGITLKTPYRSAEGIGIRADPVRLRQVIINLLSNAIKYNRPGGSVQLELHAQPDRVVVDIVDTGLGMTPEQLAHLYEPFNRLGRERGGIEGTGLGLALTRQLVDQMDGELLIESQAGRGTRARVTLQRIDAPARETRALETGPAGPEGPELSGLVLYIEDNDINAMVVEQMLARWQRVRFVHAPDGRVGIEQARLLQPDLVLLDMQLPDLDGLEVLTELRRDEATSGLYVAVLSAGAMEEDVKLALARGARQYWTKPLDLEEFLANVAEVLRRRPAHA